jgi:hypothetical protein
MLKTNDKPNKYLFQFSLGSIVVIIITSILYWKSSDLMNNKINNYIQVLTMLISAISTIISVMALYYHLREMKRNMAMSYFSITQNEINDIDKQFMDNRSLDRLYFEMYSHIPEVQELRKAKYPNHITITGDILKSEHHMSSIIFQKIADIYFCEDLGHIDQQTYDDKCEWINTFKNWMKSPILQYHWKYMKIEQHPDVRHFVDHVLISHQ